MCRHRLAALTVGVGLLLTVEQLIAAASASPLSDWCQSGAYYAAADAGWSGDRSAHVACASPADLCQVRAPGGRNPRSDCDPPAARSSCAGVHKQAGFLPALLAQAAELMAVRAALLPATSTSVPLLSPKTPTIPRPSTAPCQDL